MPTAVVVRDVASDRRRLVGRRRDHARRRRDSPRRVVEHHIAGRKPKTCRRQHADRPAKVEIASGRPAGAISAGLGGKADRRDQDRRRDQTGQGAPHVGSLLQAKVLVMWFAHARPRRPCGRRPSITGCSLRPEWVRPRRRLLYPICRRTGLRPTATTLPIGARRWHAFECGGWGATVREQAGTAGCMEHYREATASCIPRQNLGDVSEPT